MLRTDNTALLIVDVQGNLAHLMHEKENLFENLTKIIKGAQILKVPILLVEQNPAGLGPTIPELAGLFTDLTPVSKISFSCCGNEIFLRKLQALQPKNILVAGIETHVCVYQSVRDLIKAGYTVEIIADAVSSRNVENKRIGLEKIRDAGAQITSVETALFELLEAAEGDRFKRIIEIVK